MNHMLAFGGLEYYVVNTLDELAIYIYIYIYMSTIFDVIDT